jgi:putative DNA primase/helicase
LLGVPGNQVLDLKTGMLREMQRKDRVTKRANVVPDANCKPVRFLQFLQEITLGDEALSVYLLRYCGYVLTGYTREHCLPFWYGHGANGKGTLINVLQNIMGWEYGTALRMSNLAAKKNEDDSQRRIIAKLCGARLATANEGNAQVKLDMSLLKSLASSDLLAGAHLYEREFTFQPSHKLIIATNHKPELEVDAAARRRVHLVPFDAEFTGAKEDKGLEDTLKKEAPGIMALFVQSCLEWQNIGLAAPERR